MARQIDIGLRVRMGRYPGLEVAELTEDYFYPVALAKAHIHFARMKIASATIQGGISEKFMHFCEKITNLSNLSYSTHSTIQIYIRHSQMPASPCKRTAKSSPC
jgi:hypothetical protein